MNRDYALVSPSLDGILYHDSLKYEGFKRPIELKQIFDRPGGIRPEDIDNPHSRKAIEQYFNDLYSVFMKRLTAFVVESSRNTAEEVRLQSMLQEMFKIKNLLASK